MLANSESEFYSSRDISKCEKFMRCLAAFWSKAKAKAYHHRRRRYCSRSIKGSTAVYMKYPWVLHITWYLPL